MRNRWSVTLAGMLALALLVVPGCVSSKKFRGNVEDNDGRIVAVESAVEANGRQIGDLKKETDRRIDSAESRASQALSVGNKALSEAEDAAKVAQGRPESESRSRRRGARTGSGSASRPGARPRRRASRGSQRIVSRIRQVKRLLLTCFRVAFHLL